MSGGSDEPGEAGGIDLRAFRKCFLLPIVGSKDDQLYVLAHARRSVLARKGIEKGWKIRIQVAKNRQQQDGSNREGNGGRESIRPRSPRCWETTLDGLRAHCRSVTYSK